MSMLNKLRNGIVRKKLKPLARDTATQNLETAMKLYFTDRNGLDWLRCALKNANESVGRVTVKHMVFTHILICIKCGKDEEAIELFKVVFGNGGTDNYEGVILPEMPDTETGLPRIIVRDGMAEKMLELAQKAAPSIANVKRICDEIIAFGRMYQEATIDAAKKGGAVVIPYFDALSGISLMSRKHDEESFNVQPVWSEKDAAIGGETVSADTPVQDRKPHWHLTECCGGSVKAVYDERPTHTYEEKQKDGSMKTRALVHDIWHILSVILIKMVEVFALWVTRFRPVFSGKMLAEIEQRRSEDLIFQARCKLASEFKDLYATLSSCLQERIRQIREQGYAKKDQEAYERTARQDSKVQYAKIHSDLLRANHELDEKIGLDMSVMDFAKTMLYASFHDKDGTRLKDEEARSYADTIAPTEFSHFMANYMVEEGEDMNLNSEDHLYRCDFEDGEVVEFINGIAVVNECGERREARAKSEKVNGFYRIEEKEDGRRCATRRITGSEIEENDWLQADLHDYNKDELSFITVMTPKVSRTVFPFAKEAMAEDENGGYKDVLLLEYCDTPNGKVRQAVIIGDKIVSHYRKIEDWDFVVSDKDPEDTKAMKKKISAAFQNIYDGRIGRVSHVSSARQKRDENGPEFNVAVVSMDNVRKLTESELKKVRSRVYEPIETYISENKRTTAAKKKEGGSLLSRLSRKSEVVTEKPSTATAEIEIELTEDILQEASSLDDLL